MTSSRRLCTLFVLGVLLLIPAAGARATVSGTVVAWGCGSFANAGQCSVPSTLTNVTAVSAGAFHSLALLSDGTVAAWGCTVDNVGQCSVPNGLSDVVAVAAGGYHSLALKSDGTVVAWGCGIDYGQCDVPSDLSGVTAIAAGNEHSLALKNDGTVVAWGCESPSDPGPCDVPSDLSGVTAIAASGGHSLALKSDGTVVAWGCGFDWGQCTVPSGLSGVVAIAAGAVSSLALKSDGTVIAWGCGAGDAGQCNVPFGLKGVTAIAAGDSHSLARKSDGTVVAWGCENTDYGQCAVPSGLSGVTAIAAAFGHSLAVRAPAPRISGFSPASALVGTVVTISGVNLDGATSVSFAGNFGPESTTPTFVSATQVRAVVPAEAITGHIDVTTPVGIAHSAGTFRVLPQITSITPGSGPAETGVSIGGSGFAGVSVVKFAGVPARALYIYGQGLTAYVPSTALSGRITVTTGGGTVASPTVFLVEPAITTFAPSHAAPGSPVDVLGTNLGGISTVKVNGVKAGFSVLSRTQLRLTVPTSATDGPITITTAGGTATSAATLFVLPRVGSFAPTAAPVGTKVAIFGNAFTGATSVLFNGVLAVPATVTPTLITVFVPADASTGKLTVVTPSGSGQSGGTFRVLPRITSFSPGSGPAGTSVTITGSGFTDVTSVKFHGVAAVDPSVDSDHQITAQVPVSATTGRITVTTAGGAANSSTSYVVTH